MTEVNSAVRKSFPYMSGNVWAELRSRFRASLPRQVTVDYLQTVLKISEKAARNLHPQLRNIGLIDAEGAPTDLAKDFRDDEHYARACDAIIEEIYPPALLDAFPDPDSDLQGVSQWFMRAGSTGEAAGLAQARFFIMLSKREIPSNDRPPRRATANRENGTVRRTKSAPARSGAVSETTPRVTESDGSSSTQPNIGAGPSLHIDMQVHIDAGASTEQIDAIFASMAKHLYGR
jgi:hypothetical protein